MLNVEVEDKREIKQLLIVANKYLHLVNTEKTGLKDDVTTKKFKDFQLSEQLDGKVIMTSAHLASSAIRLCTIDEKLRDKCSSNEDAKEKINGFRHELYFQWLRNNNNLIKPTDDIFHFILRNNVVHIEANRRTFWKTSKEKEDCIKCQGALENSSIKGLHIEINKIKNAIESDLESLKLS